jgi:hypothetical protein
MGFGKGRRKHSLGKVHGLDFWNLPQVPLFIEFQTVAIFLPIQNENWTLAKIQGIAREVFEKLQNLTS